MGLVSFFRKKFEEDIQVAQDVEPFIADKNLYILNAFQERLIGMGHDVKRHNEYLALIVNHELEIGVMLVDNSGNHPSVIQLMVSASHPKYFPEAIIECIAGVGYLFNDRVQFALDNYINSTFVTIIDSFSDSHSSELDFFTTVNGKEVLWHPKLGDLQLQDQWGQHPENDFLFKLLKDRIPVKLTANKMNWVKIYVLVRYGGEIIGECKFNNNHWDDATTILYQDAENWEIPGEFIGLKQFIVFRRCDAYDDTTA